LQDSSCAHLRRCVWLPDNEVCRSDAMLTQPCDCATATLLAPLLVLSFAHSCVSGTTQTDNPTACCLGCKQPCNACWCYAAVVDCTVLLLVRRAAISPRPHSRASRPSWALRLQETSSSPLVLSTK
jgi:hypothetical protein